MPAIKKRITAEYMAEREQQRSEENGRPDADTEMGVDMTVQSEPTSSPPLKRKAPTQGGGVHQLKWLDGEVLLEKRKRTLPPAELKLLTWLELNFEKKPEVHLSPKSLYSFYTDMCQQDGGGVVEVHQFNKILHDKFGKEFGLKEGSVYTGLLRESKAKKKPSAKADSLGLKIKDLIEEALKASGNPTKGMRFHWIKQYIAAKYPAFQIDHRPAMLRSALERRVSYGKVELVKGIGFCGYYRLPGPSEIDEEDPKEKKKAKGDKESGNESETKEGDDVENGEKTDDTTTDEEKKESDEKGDDTKAEEGGKDKDDEGDKKPAKKKSARKPKAVKKLGYKNIDHSNPQRVEDVFPLALTYMSEPKEASFSKIKKYLEKYYGKSDIEERLRRTLENGCDSGLWDRVSGSGKSGSFQLQVDSFNPEHTESLTDMVCSALIACAEPKTASYQLIKSYINEYHPDFNIEARPHILKKAITRAIEKKALVQVTGLGMTGSFQLTEPFTPSPAILAGNEEDYSSDEGDEEGGRSGEVYVVRKTKSGRRAPVERLEYHTEKKGRQAQSPRRRSAAARGKAGRKSAPKYAESDSEESSESDEEEVDSDAEKYTPRKTKSGRGSGGQPARGGTGKTKGSVSAAKGRGVKSAVRVNSAKTSKTRKPARNESDHGADKGEKDTSTKSGRVSGGSRSAAVSKRGKAKPPDTVTRGRVTKTTKSYAEDEEENYYEIEEAAPPPAKKTKQQKTASRETVTKSSQQGKTGKGRSSKAASDSAAAGAGRPSRSASRSARQSLRENAASDSEEDEYVARPTASGRGAKKR